MYAFAPVAGFGRPLLVMGLAQLEPRQTWLGRADVVAFVVVLFYDAISWADLVLRVLAEQGLRNRRNQSLSASPRNGTQIRRDALVRAAPDAPGRRASGPAR